MSISTPVSSIILLIFLPPVPIKSLILSTDICTFSILGAYSDTCFLGVAITLFIIFSIIIVLAFNVLSKASSIIS